MDDPDGRLHVGHARTGTSLAGVFFFFVPSLSLHESTSNPDAVHRSIPFVALNLVLSTRAAILCNQMILFTLMPWTRLAYRIHVP